MVCSFTSFRNGLVVSDLVEKEIVTVWVRKNLLCLIIYSNCFCMYPNPISSGAPQLSFVITG